MLLQEPANAHPKLSDLNSHDATAQDHGKVLQTKADEHDGNSEHVVHMHGEVEPALSLGQELHRDHVHEEVGRRKTTSVHLQVSRDVATLRVVERSFSVTTKRKDTEGSNRDRDSVAKADSKCAVS